MRLCRIRLKYTPPYHPRGNYTERANRFVGESLRAMANSPCRLGRWPILLGAWGRKQDWYKLVKFVQFAYRRMFIPGTNLTPYMVARGRQPISPSEVHFRNNTYHIRRLIAHDEEWENQPNNLAIVEIIDHSNDIT